MLVTRVLSFPTGWRCLTVAVQTPYHTCTARSEDNHIVSQCREVLPGEEILFEFEAGEKLRHRHTHQLLVCVEGWEQVKLVSMDKVGVFFRYTAPDRNNPSNTMSPQVKVGSPISRPSIIHPHVYVLRGVQEGELPGPAACQDGFGQR
uniref:Uncharacterized protein n=1 Tax=Hucho hucho TaxID=62062 RepID=A0A4W5MRQ5_9TELE